MMRRIAKAHPLRGLVLVVRRLPLVALVLPLAVSCNSTKPTPIPDCQANSTAEVTVRNVGSQPVDVIWNGAVKASALAPGQTLAAFTVTAGGAQYNLEIRFAGTATLACGILVATPVQCRVNSYVSCSF